MSGSAINMANWQLDLGNPLVWLITVLLIISLLLTIRGCWQRLYQRNPSRASIVILLNLVAYTTILVLVAEPQQKHRLDQQVTLVTEGAEARSISGLHSAALYVSPGVKAISAAGTMLKNANWLLDAAQLKLREPALADIDVMGYGLKQSQWSEFPADIRITFDPPPVHGFTGMYWPRKLVVGEILQIRGRHAYHTTDATKNTAIQLRLLDPAGKLVAEARIRNGARFSLSTRPKGPGNLVYTLQARLGDSVLSEQPVTTSVGTPAAISIMVEQSAPSFETLQLKNFAAIHGARIIINTQISKGKSITRSSNLSDGAETAFSPRTLAAQDVLIMDGRAVVNLASQQRQWLTDAITNGLGLLVLADSDLLEAFPGLPDSLFAGFELTVNSDTETPVVPRLLSKPASGWLLAVPAARMRLQAVHADVLVDDEQGHALLINRSNGLGHVAISLISQSHAWLTSGSRGQWSTYWSSVIAAVSRPRAANYLLAQSDASFFSSGEKIPVCALSTADSLIAVVIPADAGQSNTSGKPGFKITLAADIRGSPRRCGWFYAQQPGWHQIYLYTDVTAPPLDQQGVYVTENDQWLAQKRQQRVDDTIDRRLGNIITASASTEGKWVLEPINKHWLWLLLVISASLLWLERKLDFDR